MNTSQAHTNELPHEIVDQPGLSVDGVSVTYSNGHTALHNASFAIPRGTVTALVGVNGAENPRYSRH